MIYNDSALKDRDHYAVFSFSQEDDVKEEPESTPQDAESTPQNAESTSQNMDEVLPLSTNKLSDPRGVHLLQSVRFVKEEPTDSCEYENPVTERGDTTQTQLVVSGATSHPITDTSVSIVNQEPQDRVGCEKSLTHSVDPTDRTVSYHQSLPVTSGTSSSLPVVSTNNIPLSGTLFMQNYSSLPILYTNNTSVHPSVIQGIPAAMRPQSVFPTIIPSVHVGQTPVSGASSSVMSTNTTTSVQPSVTSTNTTTQNQLIQGPQSVISVIIPRVNVTGGAVNHVVTGSQSLLPLTPGDTQTLGLAATGNRALPQPVNVVYMESPASQQSSSVQRSFPFPPQCGVDLQPARINVQSSSTVPVIIPVAAPVQSSVNQGGSGASQQTIVPDCELVDGKVM
jgi:hypothetical protein